MNLATPAAADERLDDAELARRAAHGDDHAFELIMRRNNRRLFRTARSILKQDADAEDAVQEAYLHAYRALDKFRGQCALSTWLTRIVINQALERLRRHKREGTVVALENVIDLESKMEAASWQETKPEGPEAAMIREQTRKLLEEKIDGLPPAFRTVFVLRALEEMSVEETAACLGIPEATVRTRLFRARALLREALAREIDVAMDGAFAFAGERCDRIVRNVFEKLRHLHRAADKPT